MPTVEELLALDLLTLREHTERAGHAIDPVVHAARLGESLAYSRICEVRRDGRLVAYAMLNPVSGSSWFVRGFNTHPEHRNASVIKDLLNQLRALAIRESISDLTSHVYKTNRLSLAFHRRLGFRITRENDTAVEFFATAEELALSPTLSRSAPRNLLLSVPAQGQSNAFSGPEQTQADQMQ